MRQLSTMDTLHLPPIFEVDDELHLSDTNYNIDEDQATMNLKPRGTTNRESVYGWYPAQWDIYSKPNYKQLGGYDTECLYRQAYNAEPGVRVPAPPGIGRPPKSPLRHDSAPVRRPSSYRLSRPQSTNSGQELKRQIQVREEKRRQLEQELRVDTRDTPVKPVSSEPQPGAASAGQLLRKSWVFNEPVKYALAPMGGPDPIPKPNLKHYGFRYGTPESSVASTPEPPTSSRPRSAASPTRSKVISCRPIRSATVRRPKFPSVPDMEKIRQELQRSTTPSRAQTPVSSSSSVSPAPSSTDTVIPEAETARQSMSRGRLKSAPPTVRRPETPTPNKAAPEITEADSRPETELQDRPVTAPESLEETSDLDDSELTYEELVDKYGWKVQIPGDPLNLKKNIIRERLPLTVTCSLPEPRTEPPKVHREVWDTFFFNTIPRRPMAFTIAPDWVSEVLHAKRMELQKREGLNYRYKDFAFVY